MRSFVLLNCHFSLCLFQHSAVVNQCSLHQYSHKKFRLCLIEQIIFSSVFYFLKKKKKTMENSSFLWPIFFLFFYFCFLKSDGKFSQLNHDLAFLGSLWHVFKLLDFQIRVSFLSFHFLSFFLLDDVVLSVRVFTFLDFLDQEDEVILSIHSICMRLSSSLAPNLSSILFHFKQNAENETVFDINMAEIIS